MNSPGRIEELGELTDVLSYPLIERATPELIYETLRARILSTEIESGSTLAQSIVARSYGVSRGPVREAFRMLQREGLIESEANYRATVTPLSIEEVEHLYAMRIVNECMALSVSLPQLSASELDELDSLVERLNRIQALNIAEWETCHQRFHGLLFDHVSDRTRSELAHWAEHTERYRRVYIQGGATGWALGATEHAQIA
jgi:DNA-binding GntR family transcriptional regulator